MQALEDQQLPIEQKIRYDRSRGVERRLIQRGTKNPEGEQDDSCDEECNRKDDKEHIAGFLPVSVIKHFGCLKPEICSIVHKHHQCPKTHIISAPRATHQPNGCQVMNDMSQKILPSVVNPQRK